MVSARNKGPMTRLVAPLLLTVVWLTCNSTVHSKGNETVSTLAIGSAGGAMQTIQNVAQTAQQIVALPLHPVGTVIKTDFDDLSDGEAPP
ncbi:g1110 [Coccomyxa elongata]